MLRRRLELPRDIVPVNDWALEVIGYRREMFEQYIGQSETMFALANGFLGMRGTHEEDRPAKEPGTFLNGFYEIRPIVYGEHAYGFPKVGQTMLNCPNGTIIKLYVDDQPFDLESAEVIGYSRGLDLREGVLRRGVTFETTMAKRVRVTSLRLVALPHRNLAAIRYEVRLEDADADLIVSSELINRQPLPVDTADPRLAQGFVGRVLQPTGARTKDLRAILSFRTQGSGLALGCGMDHRIRYPVRVHGQRQLRGRCRQGGARGCCQGARAALPQQVSELPLLGQGGTLRDPRPDGVDPRSYARGRVYRRLRTAQELRPGLLGARRRRARERRPPGKAADSPVEPVPAASGLGARRSCGIGARGLTGQTYEGHYFWDTEIYVLPFLV